MKDINLRDIASKVQETLNLTDDQFGNLNVSKLNDPPVQFIMR